MSKKAGIACQSQKATFVIQIQFQQNATWQGSVDWTEERASRHFRSELELLKLMDEAIIAGKKDDFPGWK